MYQAEDTYTPGPHPHICIVKKDSEFHAKINAEVKQASLAEKNVPVTKIVEKIMLNNFGEQPEKDLPKMENVMRAAYRYE